MGLGVLQFLLTLRSCVVGNAVAIFQSHSLFGLHHLVNLYGIMVTVISLTIIPLTKASKQLRNQCFVDVTLALVGQNLSWGGVVLILQMAVIPVLHLAINLHVVLSLH